MRRRKLVSDFRVNTRRKCMASCSFFPKFEILKANIVCMPLVHKAYLFSPILRHLLANYLQDTGKRLFLKCASENMANAFMCCQALSPCGSASTMYHTHPTPTLYRDNKTIQWLLALTCNARTQCPHQLKAPCIFASNIWSTSSSDDSLSSFESLS